MSRSLRRGALAAAAIAFSIASLAACGAGNDAQTLEIKPDNAATTVGDIKIQNAIVITQPETDAEGPAVIAATVFNNGTKRQTLDAITLPGSDVTVQLHAAEGAGPVAVPAGGSVVLGGKGNASAVIENGREAAQDGNVQAVIFKFSETGDVALRRVRRPGRPASSRASARARCRRRRRRRRPPRRPRPRPRARRRAPRPRTPAPRAARPPRRRAGRRGQRERDHSDRRGLRVGVGGHVDRLT